MAEEKPEVASPAVQEGTGTEPQQALQITHLQHVIVVLADGRKGIFAGPMFVTGAELTLKPPRISEVIICQPRPIEQPKEEASAGNTETKQEGIV